MHIICDPYWVQLPLQRNAYLIFNSDDVNLVCETNQGVNRKNCFFIFLFFFWRCFDCRWVRVVESLRGQSNLSPCFHSFRNFTPWQKVWKKSSKSTPTRILRLWNSATSPKTRHQPWHPLKTTGSIHHTNHSSTTPTPTTSEPATTTPSTTTMKRTGLLQITKSTNQPENYLHHLHQQTHMPSFTFPTIIPTTVVELLGIIAQKRREMIIPITF